MTTPLWLENLPVALTVCGPDGIILEMNHKSAESLVKYGGRDLIGKNLLDCHPEPSRTRVKDMLENHTPNIYTIEKGGVKKLIYQVPWFEGEQYGGFVELSVEIPFDMPHFIREP